METMDFYVENIRHFNEMLKSMNYSFLYDYSFDDVKKIENLCKKICLYNGKNIYDKKINVTNVFNIFLEIIKSIGNKELYEYYKEKVFEIPISFDKGMKKGNAFIEYYFIDNGIFVNSVHMSNNIKRCMDVSSYVHEMGHVACFDNKPRDKSDYFEYSEVLSILLEYFCFVFLLGKKGEEFFFKERLSLEKIAAKAGIKSINSLNRVNISDEKKQYLISDIADSNKYFVSSDFAFQCVDLVKKDRIEFLKMFSSTLLGENTVKEFGDSLGIKNDGCKRLIKEYERRM